MDQDRQAVDSAGDMHTADPHDMDTASLPFVGRWNQLVSNTNWEKGRIIYQWREALRESGARRLNIPTKPGAVAWAESRGSTWDACDACFSDSGYHVRTSPACTGAIFRRPVTGTMPRCGWKAQFKTTGPCPTCGNSVGKPWASWRKTGPVTRTW